MSIDSNQWSRRRALASFGAAGLLSGCADLNLTWPRMTETTTAEDAALLALGEPDPQDPVERRLGLFRKPGRVRFATFNTAFSKKQPGEFRRVLDTWGDEQIRAVAEIIQRVQPDVILLQELDLEPEEADTVLTSFQERFLARPHNGSVPWTFPYVYTAPVNTGAPSGLDLNRDGSIGGPGDAWGFGRFPGNYGMVVLSRYPIHQGGVRTFRTFKWADMPGALLPDDRSTAKQGDWYSPDILARMPLSSKSHWDVPVLVENVPVHLLISHPTPPAFDGPEDRNGRRNHDEVRFWLDYITPGADDYIVDDKGRFGGLARGEACVIMGDLNLDAFDGDARGQVMRRLLEHPYLNAFSPTSRGGEEAALLEGGMNTRHRGNPAMDTANFPDHPMGRAPGNLRADYVLPSKNLGPVDSGVFWPTTGSPWRRLIGDDGSLASDHRLVWVDAIPPWVADRPSWQPKPV